MKVVTHQKINIKGFDATFDIPKGGECELIDNAVYHDGHILCLKNSFFFREHFVSNEDGEWKLRLKLLQAINKKINGVENHCGSNKYWERIKQDSICQKYRKENGVPNIWMWSCDLNIAPLNDLYHITELVDIDKDEL